MGVRDVRAAAWRWVRSVGPKREHLRADTLAGMPGAIGRVPDGMAAAVLVGVNPIYGLYASMAGPLAGGLTASTRLMIITTTSAAALAAGSALAGVPNEDRLSALFLLTLLAGVVVILAGVFKLGRFMRFVSHSVMIGFLTGVAVNIVFSQLGDLTGVDAEGATSLAKAWSVIINPSSVELASLLVGASAIAIILGLNRTRLSTVGALVAVLVPSIVVAVTGMDVARVADEGDIPRGLPLPVLPDLSQLSVNLISGALAVAVIVLVQGAGVAETTPNRGGPPASVNKDFIAQGVANVTCGFFQGLPVGGSVSQTALNRAFGAQTRWASIISGLCVLLILVAFSGLIGQVAMPILAAFLIYAAIGSIRPQQIAVIWRTGTTSQIAMVTTFSATLMLPVAAAVGIGVALSLLLQLNREAMDLRVVQLVPDEDDRIVERDAPRVLRSNTLTVLDVYGSLLYAGAKTLQARLPALGGAARVVVVLRLRGRTALGATFYQVIADYAHQLARHGGRLYLSGLSPEVVRQLNDSHSVDLSGPVRAFSATDIVGESTRTAAHEAHLWLIEHRIPGHPRGAR